jgi:hypothetical protein
MIKNSLYTVAALVVVSLVLGYFTITQSGKNTLSVNAPGGFGVVVGHHDPSGGTQRDRQTISTWTCYHYAKPLDNVEIWWGHRKEDAIWACNNWNSTCGNEGGCTVSKISS